MKRLRVTALTLVVFLFTSLIPLQLANAVPTGTGLSLYYKSDSNAWTTPSRFKHIIKTKTGYRRLTPIELERLNGFPDDWTKFDSEGKQISDAKRAFFMGNALVIGLIEKVG